jgi:arginine-tRNA-protein transferase
MTLYATFPYPCPYLPDRTAVSAVYDPDAPVGSLLYSDLIRHGFRRSGHRLYRPHCPQCSACKSLRIPVADFRPSRSQRRAWRHNADLHTTLRAPEVTAEDFALYSRYQRVRHPGGEMDFDSPEDYGRACLASPVDTVIAEFREDGGRLMAVAITDVLPAGLSAVYTFFDPHEPRRSLGTLAVLWQIEYARRVGLPHVYLGYWIRESPQMAYKSRFRPAEAWEGDGWRPLGEGE